MTDLAEMSRVTGVTVVTGSVGSPRLATAIQSVASQTYTHVSHWIVVDGPEHADAVKNTVKHAVKSAKTSRQITVIVLPHNTGKSGYNAHRIYAAMPWLVSTSHVCFLDEDNAFEVDHIQNMVNAIETAPWPAFWAHSLRSIVDSNGARICLDACENLGAIRHTVLNESDFFVDVNCYLLQTSVARQVSSCWDAVARPGPGQMEVDRRLCHTLLDARLYPAVSKHHSVRYRVESRSDSVKAQFFIDGNARVKYNATLPDVYIFHISPDATRYVIDPSHTSSPLSDDALTMWDDLKKHVNLIDGYVHAKILVPGSTVLIVAPHHIPSDVARRTDLRRILVPLDHEMPPQIDANAADRVLTDDAEDTDETVWCPTTRHVLDLDKPAHRTIGLRRNLAGDTRSVLDSWTDDITIDDLQRVSFAVLPSSRIGTRFFDVLMAGCIPVLPNLDTPLPPTYDIPRCLYLTSPDQIDTTHVITQKETIVALRERVLRRAGARAFSRAVITALSTATHR